MSRYKLTLPFANFFSRNFTGSFWIVVFLVIACSYFNERCDSLSSGDRILSLVSLMGDNLGTKIQKKYENRQKIRRERENINSYKIIDFSHFTDLYFLFLCFSFLCIICRCKSFEIYFAMFLPRLYLLLQQSHLVRGYIVLNPHLPNLLIIPIAILPVLYE